MNTEELEAVLREELRQIAPDVDTETIDRDADLREEFDIDSMDFLNLVTALGRRLRLDMPEEDYPRMASYSGMLAYLGEKTA